LYLNAVSSLDAFGPLAVVLAFQPLVHLRLIFRQLSDLLCRLGKITFGVSFDFKIISGCVDWTFAVVVVAKIEIMRLNFDL
jgi:hypothetical protein